MAAEHIANDLKLAKSEAKTRNKNIYVSFSDPGENWCYGINEDSPCDCTQADQCKLRGVNKVFNNNNFRNIQLQKARFAGGGSSTAFDPKRGFATGNGSKNGTIWLKNTIGEQIAVIINRLGRIRFCSPTLGGYSHQCPTPP